MKMKDANDKSVNPTANENKTVSGTSGTSSMGGAFSSIFGFAKNSIQKTLNLGWSLIWLFNKIIKSWLLLFKILLDLDLN